MAADRDGGVTGGGGMAGGGRRPLRVAAVITKLEGGAGVLALRGARALDPASFGVTIVTGRGDHLLAEAAEAGLAVVIEPSLRTPVDPRADPAALRRLGALLREGGFDIVHTHTSKAGALGRLAAHRAGVGRIIHTYHGFPFHEFQSAGLRHAYVTVERWLGRITDLALCVGTGVAAEAVRRRLLPPQRIATIGVAVDGAGDLTGAGCGLAGGAGCGPAAGAGAAAGILPARDPVARSRARRALGIPEDATVVGAVGRLTYQKAPEDFLAALRHLRHPGRPGVTGVWVGGGELAQRIARLAARQPQAPVILAGERLDVPAVLPAFDVFALPSRYEGLPTAVVEAMVCGVPVVATAVNAVSDVVVPGQTGLLVPPGRPALLAEAVRSLLDEPAVAGRMALAARARLGDSYGMAALRAALVAAYVPGSAQPGPGRAPGGLRSGPMALNGGGSVALSGCLNIYAGQNRSEWRAGPARSIGGQHMRRPAGGRSLADAQA